MILSLSLCRWQYCSNSLWLIVSLYGTESRILCIRLNLYFIGSDFQCLFLQPSVYRSIYLVFLTFCFWLSVSSSSSWTVVSVPYLRLSLYLCVCCGLPLTVFLSVYASLSLTFCVCLRYLPPRCHFFCFSCFIFIVEQFSLFYLTCSISGWFVAKTMRIQLDLISSYPDFNIDLYTITNL